MTRNLLLTATAVLTIGLTGAPVHAAASIPKPVAAAVADPARPAADKDRDAGRKPAETTAFAGIKPGQKIVELFPGGGYYTRVLSGIVGTTGHVYALAPPRRPNAPEGAPDPAAAVQAIAADSHYSNVTVGTFSIQEIKVAEPVDVVWTSNNYHDFHNIPNGDMVAFDKQVLNALKPGGVFIVVDHAAEPGSGFRDTSTLHRIDPEAVKKEVESAGFTFVGASDVLHSSADSHTEKVFDASVRGKTDQFILKFSKPK
jgi:predicted methyltransferase